MKRTIKIKFVDFWSDFNSHSNFITLVLSELYNIEISDNPDYLFYSTLGHDHADYNCVKILFIGENVAPDFNTCDYAIGFDFMSFGDRYLRLPLYQIYSCFADLEKKKSFDEAMVLARKFCCVVVSNSQFVAPQRERFFRLLSEYKQVDSGGRLWNNIGGPVSDKLDFVSQYKFNIAFENSSVLGYTTEKIMQPMVVNTLPIYWGNKLVARDFNPQSFINVNDFPSLESAVQYIVDIDCDDSKYLDIMREPWIIDDNILQWKTRLRDFLVNIIEKPIDVARYLSDYGHQKIYRSNLYSSYAIYGKTGSNLFRAYKFIDKVVEKARHILDNYKG